MIELLYNSMKERLYKKTKILLPDEKFCYLMKNYLFDGNYLLFNGNSLLFNVNYLLFNGNYLLFNRNYLLFNVYHIYLMFHSISW